MNMNRLSVALRSLTVFRNLLTDPVLSAFAKVLQTAELSDRVDAYCEFVSCLYASHRPVLSEYIGSIVGDDENIYIRYICRGVEPSAVMLASVKRELTILQRVADTRAEELKRAVGWEGELPDYGTAESDLVTAYLDRCANIGKYGYGMYSRYYVFYVNDEGQIVPVHSPDTISLAELIDYEREKKIIWDNTLALIHGRPAANMLLTGDAGTGKSSTVKAVVNALHTEGVRIIEVRKEQLYKIPAILDELNENPLKFILFIDDLSFQKDDDNFSALKAILEGSVSAKSGNTVIYATSNRRHLVKESFSDRDGDDVHRNDTMQEIISLSERFGIQLSFYRPDKKTYLNIVRHLAEQSGISMSGEELEAEAEKFALNRGNRSARAARQFIDSILSKEGYQS